MLRVGALANAGTPAPLSTRLGAIVQSAVFDAVNGIERRYTSIHVEPAGPRGASRAAAAASAAHETLVALFPAQSGMLDAQLATSLAAIGDDSDSKPSGLSWGKTVADDILAWRAADHFSDPLALAVRPSSAATADERALGVRLQRSEGVRKLDDTGAGCDSHAFIRPSSRSGLNGR